MEMVSKPCQDWFLHQILVHTIIEKKWKKKLLKNLPGYQKVRQVTKYLSGYEKSQLSHIISANLPTKSIKLAKSLPSYQYIVEQIRRAVSAEIPQGNIFWPELVIPRRILLKNVLKMSKNIRVNNYLKHVQKMLEKKCSKKMCITL